jgi:hypothetical protein
MRFAHFIPLPLPDGFRTIVFLFLLQKSIQKEEAKKKEVHVDDNVPAPSPRSNGSVRPCWPSNGGHCSVFHMCWFCSWNKLGNLNFTCLWILFGCLGYVWAMRILLELFLLKMIGVLFDWKWWSFGDTDAWMNLPFAPSTNLLGFFIRELAMPK